MNKSPKMYNCEYCEYKTSIKCNYQKHLNCKHKKVETINEPTNDLQREIDRLKAEIETLKTNHKIELIEANHKIELMELKLSMYENQQINPSRKSISPAKSNEETIDVIPKKRHNENTLDYLNKHFPPIEYSNVEEYIIEQLKWEDINISLENIDTQYISILKPLITKYKLIFHSGEKNHTIKLYYIDHEQKWIEDLTYLELPISRVWVKIGIAFDEKIKTLDKDEHCEYIGHYETKPNRNNIVKHLLDVMKLPE